MRLIRRVAATLAMAVIAAVGVRLGRQGGTPRQHGGWKQIDLSSHDVRTPNHRDRGPDSATADAAVSVTEMHIVTRSDDVPAAVVATG